MVKTAFLFPGQGSQSVGMGGSIMAASDAAREVIETVDEALGGGLKQIMLEGPADTLTLTCNAQPALMATSVAVVRALENALGKPIDKIGDFVAGHSLGEYAALTAVGVFDVALAAKLLRLRGEAMQNAVAVGEGAMAALLGGEIKQVESILAKIKTGVVSIANDNATGQIVISGETSAVNAAIEEAKASGVKRAILLPVSAPFHCSLMSPAAEVMAQALGEAPFGAPNLPVVTNTSATAQTNTEVLRDHLVAQVTGRVRWRETLLTLADQGVSRFIEVGTGKVLSGLVKRTVAEAETFNIETTDDLEAALALF